MKHTIIIIVLFVSIALGCKSTPEPENTSSDHKVVATVDIPKLMIPDSLLSYNNNVSLWTLNGELFSGYAVSYYQNETLKSKTGFLEGKKQNQSMRWYEDGHLKHLATYERGKLHGAKKTWSSDEKHVLISHLNYQTGKAHGEQKKWYPTGELFKKLNLNMGIEEGLQQAFRKNGDLFANYEAKEGRIFGLKKSALCYGLENENIQHD